MMSRYRWLLHLVFVAWHLTVHAPVHLHPRYKVLIDVAKRKRSFSKTFWQYEPAGEKYARDGMVIQRMVKVR